MEGSKVDLFVILKDNFINIPIKSVTQTYHINTFLSVRYLKLPSAVIFAIFRSTLREGVKVKIWKLSLLRFIMKVRATIHFPLKVKILLLDLLVLRAPTVLPLLWQLPWQPPRDPVPCSRISRSLIVLKSTPVSAGRGEWCWCAPSESPWTTDSILRWRLG